MWWLLLACARRTEAPLEPATFTEEMGSRLHKRLTRHEVEGAGELALRVTSPDGFELELDLASLFEDCERSRSSCEDARIAWVERQGRNAQARSEPFRLALVRPRLMSEAEARRLELTGRPWLVGLVEVPSLDAESASRGLTLSELRTQDLELDEALDVGRRQLEAEAQLTLEGLGGASRVLYSPRAADLLLVDALWSEGILVLAVRPDLLLVGDDADRLVELAAELSRPEAEALSERVLVRTATGWQVR
jgi:hypothetical protein